MQLGDFKSEAKAVRFQNSEAKNNLDILNNRQFDHIF